MFRKVRIRQTFSRFVRMSPKPTPEHLPCSRSVIRVHQPLNQGPRAVAHQKPEQRAQQKWYGVLELLSPEQNKKVRKHSRTVKLYQRYDEQNKEAPCLQSSSTARHPATGAITMSSHVSQAFLSRTKCTVEQQSPKTLSQQVHD